MTELIKDLITRQSIISNIKESIGSPRELLPLLVKIMESIETEIPRTEGPRKKQIALNILKQIITDSDIDQRLKTHLITLSDMFADTFIESVIKVSKGEIILNKIKKSASGLEKIILFFKKFFQKR